MNLSKENMGLNLPMLLANSQPLDSWNPVNQFSPPPVNEHNQHLRLPLPMPFPPAPPQSDLSATGTNVAASSSLFGGSNNSSFVGSPQKPMDTADGENDDGKENDNECERISPSNTRATSVPSSTDGRLSVAPSGTPGEPGSENGTCIGDANSVGRSSTGGGGGGSGGGGGAGAVDASRRSDGNSGNEAGSSPIPNTITFEAHKQRHLIPGGAVPSGSRGHDDLDIKQELLENYFHAPHPPVPPDSHRSYNLTDENRHVNDPADEYAQDLRISAAAAAAAKSIDFSRFVLPPSLRRSTESIDEKFIPLNMRKLNPASVSNSQAGQMLMNSLLSNESMSEENTSVSGRIKSGRRSGNTNSIGESQDASPSAATAAAAAAFYAESLNKDDCDFIGSNVSVKLRAMNRTQRIIAEKLISEVLFYGQFNELERTARISPK